MSDSTFGISFSGSLGKWSLYAGQSEDGQVATWHLMRPGGLDVEGWRQYTAAMDLPTHRKFCVVVRAERKGEIREVLTSHLVPPKVDGHIPEQWSMRKRVDLHIPL
jgi:hypothetical protein